MSILMMLALSSKKPANIVTRTFTSNQSVTIPAGVSVLLTANGKGSAGSPGGSYPDAFEFLDSSTVQAVNINGNGPFPVLSWEGVDSYNNSLRSQVNNGGSGSDSTGFLGYTGYTGDGTAFWQFRTVTWTDAIAGTATIIRSGWGSGFIIAGANGSASVRYMRRGGTYPPSSGVAATGFGKVFPGGGPNAPAPTTQFVNVSVTGGSSYNVVIPSGGFITITYEQP